MTLRILATDLISEEGLAPLRDDDRFVVEQVDQSGGPEFEHGLKSAHGLIVRSSTTVDSRMLDSAPVLRVIGRAGVGVDNIDISAATQRGIAVLNAPGANTVAAAELTMALILSLVRRVTEADRSVREGKWDRSRFRGVELRGRTVGLVGMGRVGGEVAKRCRAFGMDVLTYDPSLSEERAAELGVRSVELDYLLEHSDVVSLHVPLTERSRGMIDGVALKTMKPQAFLVNAARGGIVDEVALAGALRQGDIAGAALDVFEDEPLRPESPLLQAPNLVLTPHLGASTEEAQVEVAREVALRVRTALLENDFSLAVNAAELV